MEKQIELVRQVVLKRVPPGDRWQDVNSESPIFSSLTDGLDWVYQKTGRTDYFISARRGIVETLDEVQTEAPIKRYSIYEED